jgi:hypothetical protein
LAVPHRRLRSGPDRPRLRLLCPYRGKLETVIEDLDLPRYAIMDERTVLVVSKRP